MEYPSAPFWAAFAEQHWERMAGVFRGVLSEPLLTEDEIFAGVVEAYDRYELGQPAMIRVYLDGHRVTDGAGQKAFFPLRSDETLSGYLGRLQKNFGMRRFGIVVNRFSEFLPCLFAKMRRFFAGLVATVGLPAAHVDPALFLGNYEATPFGIHRDTGSVFTFSLLGHKRILTWPRSFFDAQGITAIGAPDQEQILLAALEPFSAHGIPLEGGPEDVIYWPSSDWHIAVSTGGLSATLGVAVQFRARVESIVTAALKRTVSSVLPPTLGTLSPGPSQLPNELEKVIAGIEELVRSGSLARAIREDWLSRRTSMACPGPPPIEDDLAAARVRMATGVDQVIHVQGGVALVATNGVVTELSPVDLSVLEALRRGEDVEVPAIPDALRSHLVAVRALEDAVSDTSSSDLV